MPRPRITRLALAVPTALLLALGGALLAAAPASAAVGDPVVITSPVDGSTLSSRNVNVTGTGSDGETITVSTGEGVVYGSTPVASGGAWSLQVTFTDDAAPEQRILVSQSTDATTADGGEVSITLPPPPAPNAVTVAFPDDGATNVPRFSMIQGGAVEGASIVATVGDVVVAEGVAGGGGYNLNAYFPPEVGDEVELTVAAENPDGTVPEPVTLQLALLEAVDAPVLTAPSAGQSVTAGEVTFRGTGTPGLDVLLLIRPDAATIASGVALTENQAAPFGEVAADGSITITATLPAGRYQAAALLTNDLRRGTEYTQRSLRSNVLEVTVSPAAAAATPAAPELADTGAVSATLAGPAAALLLGGLVLLVLSRRRVGSTAA